MIVEHERRCAEHEHRCARIVANSRTLTGCVFQIPAVAAAERMFFMLSTTSVSIPGV